MIGDKEIPNLVVLGPSRTRLEPKNKWKQSEIEVFPSFPMTGNQIIRIPLFLEAIHKSVKLIKKKHTNHNIFRPIRVKPRFIWYHRNQSNT